MKKAATIFLLIVFLGANTSLGQLFKLPILIEHFHSHTHEDENGHADDFLSFLFSHYSNESGSSSTKHGHDKLPFKTANSFTSNNVVIIPSNNQEPVHYFTATSNLSEVFYNEDYSSAYLDSIWQPPRSC